MKSLSILLLSLLVIACGQPNPQTPQAAEEIDWDALVPEEYSSDAIMVKYQDKIEQMEDDTPEAEALYQKIMDEMANAPLNKKLDNKYIKLPGFIAPLSQQNGRITEFLLVPYFGACIHVPPPPLNQTVLVKTAAGNGIWTEEVYEPIWVSGPITLEGKKTDIGEAGYLIAGATIEKYESY
ncbi:MAG: DUF3299 domain-containing protein [Pseudomonadota bacterium]